MKTDTLEADIKHMAEEILAQWQAGQPVDRAKYRRLADQLSGKCRKIAMDAFQKAESFVSTSPASSRRWYEESLRCSLIILTYAPRIIKVGEGDRSIALKVKALETAYNETATSAANILASREKAETAIRQAEVAAQELSARQIQVLLPLLQRTLAAGRITSAERIQQILPSWEPDPLAFDMVNIARFIQAALKWIHECHRPFETPLKEWLAELYMRYLYGLNGDDFDPFFDVAQSLLTDDQGELLFSKTIQEERYRNEYRRLNVLSRPRSEPAGNQAAETGIECLYPLDPRMNNRPDWINPENASYQDTLSCIDRALADPLNSELPFLLRRAEQYRERICLMLAQADGPLDRYYEAARRNIERDALVSAQEAMKKVWPLPEGFQQEIQRIAPRENYLEKYKELEQILQHDSLLKKWDENLKKNPPRVQECLEEARRELALVPTKYTLLRNWLQRWVQRLEVLLEGQTLAADQELDAWKDREERTERFIRLGETLYSGMGTGMMTMLLRYQEFLPGVKAALEKSRLEYAKSGRDPQAALAQAKQELLEELEQLAQQMDRANDWPAARRFGGMIQAKLETELPGGERLTTEEAGAFAARARWIEAAGQPPPAFTQLAEMTERSIISWLQEALALIEAFPQPVGDPCCFIIIKNVHNELSGLQEGIQFLSLAAQAIEQQPPDALASLEKIKQYKDLQSISHSGAPFTTVLHEGLLLASWNLQALAEERLKISIRQMTGSGKRANLAIPDLLRQDSSIRPSVLRATQAALNQRNLWRRLAVTGGYRNQLRRGQPGGPDAPTGTPGDDTNDPLRQVWLENIFQFILLAVTAILALALILGLAFYVPRQRKQAGSAAATTIAIAAASKHAAATATQEEVEIIQIGQTATAGAQEAQTATTQAAETAAMATLTAFCGSNPSGYQFTQMSAIPPGKIGTSTEFQILLIGECPWEGKIQLIGPSGPVDFELIDGFGETMGGMKDPRVFLYDVNPAITRGAPTAAKSYDFLVQTKPNACPMPSGCHFRLVDDNIDIPGKIGE